MPYTARYEGEERGAWSVPKNETAYCTECDAPMMIVSEGVDGTARHFRHNIWKAGYSPSGGNASGQRATCGGGEDDVHKKWKNFAAERLADIFGDRAATRPSVEVRLAAPWSDSDYRYADACVLFENADRQFGRGLAVEVQHKNDGKDIHAVAMDYQRQDIAVLWLYEDDFNRDGLPMAEVDIRHRVRSDTSICAMCDKWAKVGSDVVGREHSGVISHVRDPVRTGADKVLDVVDPREANRKVPAKLPTEWFDTQAQRIWRKQRWRDIFPDADGYGDEVVDMPPYPDTRFSIKIDFAQLIDREQWRQWWLKGMRNSPVDVGLAYVCDICGDKIQYPDHAESNFKMFKFHMKRQHKQRLKRATGRNPYKRFVRANDF